MLALITGASLGIGRDISFELASRGYSLVLVARDRDKLSELVHDISQKYPKVTCHIISMDLSAQDSAQKLYNEVTQQKLSIDILVNNAGFGDLAFFAEEKIEIVQQMLNLNIHTLTLLCRYFLPSMVEKKSGKIMNVASLAAFQAGPWMSVYYATKAYVLHFSEGLVEELKGTGVSVTTLCPGPTLTNFGAVAQVSDKLLFKIPFFRMYSNTVAKEAVDGLLKGKPIVLPGLVNKIIAQTNRLALRSLSRKIVGRLHKS